MIRAGVIGLGVIGSGVSLCLARAGMLVAAYDVRKSAADGLDGVPAICASPRELARQCDVIVIAVVSAQQTIDVLSGEDGVLAAARPGLDIVLVATVALQDLLKIREMTEQAGVGLIDCGVTGGPAARQKGLVCLVGAEPAAFARVLPVLDGFAKSVFHMGGPGAGMAGKIARNVIFYGCLRAGYEGAALAQAAGVSVRQLTQVIESSAEGVGGPMMLMSRPADPRTDPQEAQIRESLRELMLKDLSAALDLGRELDVALPLAELVCLHDRTTAGLDPIGDA